MSVSQLLVILTVTGAVLLSMEYIRKRTHYVIIYHSINMIFSFCNLP